jgi:hypothetical protein
MPPTDFDDSGIATGTILEAWRESVKQLAHDGFVPNDSQRLTPGMQAASFAQRNDTISPPSYLFGFRIRGLNSLIA